MKRKRANWLCQGQCYNSNEMRPSEKLQANDGTWSLAANRFTKCFAWQLVISTKICGTWDVFVCPANCHHNIIRTRKTSSYKGVRTNDSENIIGPQEFWAALGYCVCCNCPREPLSGHLRLLSRRIKSGEKPLLELKWYGTFLFAIKQPY